MSSDTVITIVAGLFIAFLLGPIVLMMVADGIDAAVGMWREIWKARR